MPKKIFSLKFCFVLFLFFFFLGGRGGKRGSFWEFFKFFHQKKKKKTPGASIEILFAFTGMQPDGSLGGFPDLLKYQQPPDPRAPGGFACR